jgi:hypothetical protein
MGASRRPRPRRGDGTSDGRGRRLGWLLLWSLLAIGLACFAGDSMAVDWERHEDLEQRVVDQDLAYVRRAVTQPGASSVVTAHLIAFTSKAYRLEVIDLGDGSRPRYPSLARAFAAAGSPAGVNGGFFHPDWSPAGLVIAQGERINRLETAKLLSGVLYSDARGIHLVRRSAFRDHAEIDALLQTGPYLVEGAQAVRGLAPGRPSRRTFIATDWRGHWVLGATLDALSLEALAQILVSPGALTDWPVERAINLDGGSSTGVFFGAGDVSAPLSMTPLKRVRTLLGIVRR